MFVRSNYSIYNTPHTHTPPDQSSVKCLTYNEGNVVPPHPSSRIVGHRRKLQHIKPSNRSRYNNPQSPIHRTYSDILTHLLAQPEPKSTIQTIPRNDHSQRNPSNAPNPTPTHRRIPRSPPPPSASTRPPQKATLRSNPPSPRQRNNPPLLELPLARATRGKRARAQRRRQLRLGVPGALHAGVDLGAVRDVRGHNLLGAYWAAGVSGVGEGVDGGHWYWESGEFDAGFALSPGF